MFKSPGCFSFALELVTLFSLVAPSTISGWKHTHTKDHRRANRETKNEYAFGTVLSEECIMYPNRKFNVSLVIVRDADGERAEPMRKVVIIVQTAALAQGEILKVFCKTNRWLSI